ncbi:NAD-dependent epimerase/dehydratase family protein [Cupriavidus basilensis]
MASSERFLVTGALGCIGAWILRRLVEEDVPVVAFDTDTDTRRLRLLMNDEQLSRVTLVRGDITDLSLVEDTLDRHEITHIIHLAAVLYPRFKSDPPLGARVNVLGGVNLFEAVARRSNRVRQIVYASSIAAYDKSGGVDKLGMARPGTLYGVFKQAEEAMAKVYFHDRAVSSIGLRPATVFGPGRDFGLTAAPTQAILAAAQDDPFRFPTAV